MATSAAFVAAAVARTRREICDHLEAAGAFAPGQAVSYMPPRQMHERQLARLVAEGVVRDTGGGRYWLDREELALAKARRARGLTIGIAILAGVGFALLVVSVARALAGS